MLNRRDILCFELEDINRKRENLLKELTELDVSHVKHKVETDGAYFVCQDFYYLNKELFSGYKCVPATLQVPIERFRNGSIRLLRNKSFFLYKEKTYNYDASDYYGSETDEAILSDISGKDSAKFVYEEDHIIVKNNK